MRPQHHRASDQAIAEAHAEAVRLANYEGNLARLADHECVHGRLPGQACPSNGVTLSSGKFVQSWPHPYPCGCWPEEQRQPQLQPITVEHADERAPTDPVAVPAAAPVAA